MLHRAFALQDMEIRGEGRTLAGTVVPYDVEVNIGPYRERFARGAFTGTVPAAVPLLIGHRHASLPIGAAVELRDEPDRLAGEFTISDTRDADEVLTLARDRVPLALSVGFLPTTDRWTTDRRAVVRVRAVLGEVSVVARGAYPGALVESVRAAPDQHTAPLLALARRMQQ